MNPRILFLCIFTIIAVNAFSVTWHIKQDGTGNFTTIQEGIDASTHTDTILVYPGTYYENINFSGNNITLASLEMTTGNPQYIYQTIIDGQRISSCICINSNETVTCIRGLTITNGQGENDYQNGGGGITIYAQQNTQNVCDIKNCRIFNNYGEGSAGILIVNAIVNLSGTTISANYASRAGGAMGIIDYAQVNFDIVDRCNIYDNLAAYMSEIYIASITITEFDVIVDTFTVMQPNEYFVSNTMTIPMNYNYDILNCFLEPIDNDLFVSPNGDDSNTGLSVNDAFRTINLAIRNIASNPENPRTVHLLPGIYTNSTNPLQLPFGCKTNVNICGDSQMNTIIDGEYSGSSFFLGLTGYSQSSLSELFFFNGLSLVSLIQIHNCDDIEFNNIKILDGHILDGGAAITSSSSGGNISLENVMIDNITVDNMGCSGAQFNGATSLKVMNSTFSNNISLGHTCLSAGLYTLCNGDITIENCKFYNNSTTSTTFQGYASALLCADSNNMIGDTYINNCLFYNNTVNNGRSTIFAQSIDYTTVHFTNNTLINNQSPYGIEFEGNINFTNNILQNEGDYEIALFDKTSQGIISEINIAYSNIEAGENAIFNENNANIINWNEGNIEEEPHFLLSGEDPYQLSEISPCIDAGTPDTTGLFLPPWDLLHHQRVWDGDVNGVATIDMGCYEFGADSVGVEDHQLPLPDAPLTNYPNPFNPSTTISFSLTTESTENTELVIYNIKGQKVKTLMDCYTAPGKYECVWNGRNDNGKRVACGQYVVKLLQNEKETTVKIMLLK